MSCNTDLFKSYNTVRSRPESYSLVCPPRAVTHQGALMSVTPNFCCDETKNSSDNQMDVDMGSKHSKPSVDVRRVY